MNSLSIVSALLSLISFSLFASSVSASSSPLASLKMPSRNVSLSDDDSSVEEALNKEPLFVFIDDDRVFVADDIKYKIERASGLIRRFEVAKKASSNSEADKKTLIGEFQHIINSVDGNILTVKYRDEDQERIEMPNFNYNELASVLIHNEGRLNENHFYALYDFMKDPNHSFFYSLVDEMNAQITILKESYKQVTGEEDSLSLSIMFVFMAVVIASFGLLAWAIIPIIFKKRRVVDDSTSGLRFEKE